MYLPNRSKSKPAAQPRPPKPEYKAISIIAYDGANWNDMRTRSSILDNLDNGSYKHRFLPIWNRHSGKKHLIDISNIREIVIEENETLED